LLFKWLYLFFVIGKQFFKLIEYKDEGFYGFFVKIIAGFSHGARRVVMPAPSLSSTSFGIAAGNFDSTVFTGETIQLFAYPA
jgi:hypothetical protein